MCLCFGCGGVGGEWAGGLDQGRSDGVVLCLCELLVRIICVDGKSRYLYIVFGGYLRILCAPSVQSCCTLWISASYSVFGYGRYRKSILVCVRVSDLDLSRHHPLL